MDKPSVPTFKAGQQIIHTGEGLGYIEAIVTETYGGYTQQFYVIKVKGGKATIKIPVTGSSVSKLKAVDHEFNFDQVIFFHAVLLPAGLDNGKHRFLRLVTIHCGKGYSAHLCGRCQHFSSILKKTDPDTRCRWKMAEMAFKSGIASDPRKALE